jgi:hypothetical protein
MNLLFRIGASYWMNRMNNILVKSLLGIALLGAVGVASAATLSSIPTGPSLSPGDVGTVSASVTPGSFSNDWYFSLASASTVGAVVTNIALTIAPGVNFAISGLSATLFDTTTSTTYASGSTSYSGLSLPGDNFKLEVTGTGTGTVGGLYQATVGVAAVPLPAAAWLLLSGLAGMGLIARRRRAG